MKETYSKPMMDVEEFSTVEVLTVSGGGSEDVTASGIEEGNGISD